MARPLEFDEATKIAKTIHEDATVVVGILDDLLAAQPRLAEIHDDTVGQET